MILEAARAAEIDRVVYGSTIWVYGNAPAEATLDEDAPLAPADAPLHGDEDRRRDVLPLVRRSCTALEHTILRFGIPYGPRARPPRSCRRSSRGRSDGKPLTIAGDGRQTRQFVYVEDLADGRRRGARARRGEPRLQPRRRREDERAADRATRCASSSRDGADRARPGAARRRAHRAASPARARRASSAGAPTTPFADGVRRYVDWLTRDERLAASRTTAASTDGSAAAVLRQEPAEL